MYLSMHLFGLSNVFVWIVNTYFFLIHLSKLQSILVQMGKYIWPNCEIYLSKCLSSIDHQDLEANRERLSLLLAVDQFPAVRPNPPKSPLILNSFLNSAIPLNCICPNLEMYLSKSKYVIADVCDRTRAGYMIVVGYILLFIPTADVIVAQIHGERQFLVHTC